MSHSRMSSQSAQQAGARTIKVKDPSDITAGLSLLDKTATLAYLSDIDKVTQESCNKRAKLKARGTPLINNNQTKSHNIDNVEEEEKTAEPGHDSTQYSQGPNQNKSSKGVEMILNSKSNSKSGISSLRFSKSVISDLRTSKPSTSPRLSPRMGLPPHVFIKATFPQAKVAKSISAQKSSVSNPTYNSLPVPSI